VRRRAYFSTGLATATLWCVGALGFVQDLMGPEAWTRCELLHWKPAWVTMPLHCIFLATSIVLWRATQQRASKEDQKGMP
jgi:hypothetical protein